MSSRAGTSRPDEASRQDMSRPPLPEPNTSDRLEPTNERNTMTTLTIFKYHDTEHFASAVVSAAWYNSDTQELALSLNGEVWVYNSVPKSVFDSLLSTYSAGRYYATYIKPTYGPGTNIGWDDDIDFRDVGQDETVTKNQWTIAPDAKITTAQPNNVFALKVPEAQSLRTYKVTFTVNDSDERKHYSLSVANEQEALGSIAELASALGLTFNVKEVTGYFE